jgi:hypothetical protein
VPPSHVFVFPGLVPLVPADLSRRRAASNNLSLFNAALPQITNFGRRQGIRALSACAPSGTGSGRRVEGRPKGFPPRSIVELAVAVGAGLFAGRESDKISVRTMIQIESAKAPFTDPRIAFQAVTAFGRADAMGLLPRDERIETLDLSSFRRFVRHIHRAGIARNIPLDLTDASEPNLERILERLNLALEESPVPDFEWNRMIGVLGLDLLARLLGISVTSCRRYRANARTTPDDVAERLHFLSLVVGDLAGAYNEIGVRQWFERRRVQLDGRTPFEWLKGRWKPAQPGPRRVQELARALAASPAT